MTLAGTRCDVRVPIQYANEWEIKKKTFHSAAACCEALHAELGQEKQRPQHNDERVAGDPLIAQLKNIAQQGVFQ